MRLIPNQSHQAVKWVILRSLWSLNEGFGIELRGAWVTGVCTRRKQQYWGAGYLCMRPSISKGLGKKCKKEEEEEKEMYINQTSISKLPHLRKLVSFLKFIVCCLSDSFSGFSFYNIFFLFQRVCITSEQQTLKHCIMYESSGTPGF